jgi:hypothetical protein
LPPITLVAEKMVFDRRVHNFSLGGEYLAVFAISDDGTSIGSHSGMV